MEKLWSAIWDKLSNDATLITMTGYTTATRSIKRGNSSKKIAFSDTVLRAVTFQQWTNVRYMKTSTAPIRDITVLFSCWSKKNDLQCVQLRDYLMTLLDGVDLSNADMFNYYSEYDDFSPPPYYDKDEKSWRIDLRFRFRVILL